MIDVNYVQPPCSVTNVNGKTTTTAEETALEFLSSFFPDSNPVLTQNLNPPSSLPNNIINNGRINGNEIDAVLNRMQTSGAPGCDVITVSMLKHVWSVVPEALCLLLSSVLDNKMIPATWKHAKVIALPKPGKDKKNDERLAPDQFATRGR